MSNPTSNFGWQMPTSSDLVTDLPADFEVFGQAVDTSLADLKGGTTGQLLSKASGTDMDFTWTTISSGGITLLSTTSLSGSSVTISSISGSYKMLKLIISASDYSGNYWLRLRINGDTGASVYKWNLNGIQGGTWYGDGVLGGAYMELFQVDSNSNQNRKGYSEINFPNYTESVGKFVNATSSTVGSGVAQDYWMAGAYSGTSAITSLTLYPSGGTFSGGNAYLYGVS